MMRYISSYWTSKMYCGIVKSADIHDKFKEMYEFNRPKLTKRISRLTHETVHWKNCRTWMEGLERVSKLLNFCFGTEVVFYDWNDDCFNLAFIERIDIQNFEDTVRSLTQNAKTLLEAFEKIFGCGGEGSIGMKKWQKVPATIDRTLPNGMSRILKLRNKDRLDRRIESELPWAKVSSPSMVVGGSLPALFHLELRDKRQAVHMTYPEFCSLFPPELGNVDTTPIPFNKIKVCSEISRVPVEVYNYSGKVVIPATGEDPLKILVVLYQGRINYMKIEEMKG